MTKDELKSEFKALHRKGKLDECFNLLDKYVSKHTDIDNEIATIQARYENNRRLSRKGTTNESFLSMEINAISESILHTVNEIKEGDMAEPALDMKSSRILIICLNDSDEFYMRAFCSRMRIPNYEVKQLKEYEEPTEYDFIIFDNHSIKNIEENFRQLKDEEKAHIKLMEEYIEEYNDHKKYMIHFGENTSVVSNNRDIIYAGNSKFALYSRIQEMIQYISNDRLYKKNTEGEATL